MLLGAAALDVILFVREAFERLEPLRSTMLTKILESLPSIKASRVCVLYSPHMA